jgi:hypothetical protein
MVRVGSPVSIHLPRIEVPEADTDMVRIVAIHCLREAAEHLAIGRVVEGRALAEAAMVWLEGWA